MASLKENLFSFKTAFKILCNVVFVMEPKVLYHKLLLKTSGEERAYEYSFSTIKKWSDFIVKTAKMNITVEGLEKIPTDRPVLFTPNHQSFADIPVLLHVLKDFNFGFLMRGSLNNFFAVDHLSKTIKCVPIDQSNPRDSLRGLQKVAEQIKEGLSMVIFPEGKRYSSNTPSEFKNGAFRIVQKTGVTVVPIYMRNVFNVFEGHDNRITPTNILITILDPIETANMTRTDVKQLHDKVYNIILDESKKYNDCCV